MPAISAVLKFGAVEIDLKIAAGKIIEAENGAATVKILIAALRARIGTNGEVCKMIRKARTDDIGAVAAIYDAIHDLEEQGKTSIGWKRGIYPTSETALQALNAGELFVLEADGEVIASAKINREQMPAYAEVSWRYPASPDQVMVLHTLTVAPWASGKGYGREFLKFYETYALEQGCPILRIDTNARNIIAREMYRRHGYIESGIIPCSFNGIEGVNLVCMEKSLK